MAKKEFWRLSYKKPKSGRLLTIYGEGTLRSLQDMADLKVAQEHPSKGYRLYGATQIQFNFKTNCLVS